MSDDDEPTKVQLVGTPSGTSGKLIKWSIILILTGLTGGTFLILYLGWKYVKLCFLFYFKALYLIIRLPIWLFIQLPLHYLGVGMHKTSQSLKDAYGVISMKRKRYGVLFGLLSLFMIYNFLPRNTDAMISFLTDATLILPLLALIPFMITFFIAWLSAHIGSPDIARKDMPGGLNTGMKERTATAGAAAAAAGQGGLKAYNSIEGDNINEKMENAKEAADIAKNQASNARTMAGEAAEGEGLAVAEGESILAGDMVATLEGMPLIGSLMGGAGEAAGMVGTATAASGGTIAIAIAALILGFIIINAILAALTFWIAGIVIPMILGPIMGPIMGALGLGQAYGNWFGSELANNLLPQIDLTAEMRMIEQAGAKVGCALQGPACLRQWRLNNTARPGSEDVGEKYRVEIQEFDIGGQGGVDIAYKKPDYAVPLSFLLLNTRHGLKGIDANNVKYRIRINDADRSGKKAYCGTGWKEVSSAYGGSGTLLPGTSFSPTIGQVDELTIGKCDMLMAALGHDYTGELDVKYQYSSQSTLYVEAMSRKNMRDNEITPSFKKSETADTPVETFVNVKAPITYIDNSRTDSNSPRAIPFTVKVGTATDRYDIEYKVHTNDFMFVDSSKTSHTESTCRGLNRSSGDRYTLSKRAENRMINRIEPGDTGTWFDKAKNPAPARCVFRLENPGTVSPTGETLTMRVDANYTVVVEQTSDPFEVRNTQCSQYNCPILFYLEGEEFGDVASEEMPPDKWDLLGSGDPVLSPDYQKYRNATCDGIDAGNGCSATEKYQSYYNDSELQGGIESGEIAVNWSETVANTKKIFSCNLRNDSKQIEKDVVGIDQNDIQNSIYNDNVVIEESAGEFQITDYQETVTFDAASGIPDWVLEASYSQTKKAVGCAGGEPQYKISCSSLNAGGGAMYVAGAATGGAGLLAAGATDFLTGSGPGSCSSPPDTGEN